MQRQRDGLVPIGEACTKLLLPRYPITLSMDLEERLEDLKTSKRDLQQDLGGLSSTVAQVFETERPLSKEKALATNR